MLVLCMSWWHVQLVNKTQISFWNPQTDWDQSNQPSAWFSPCCTLRLKHVHVHYSIFVHDLIQTFYSMQHAACSMQHAARSTLLIHTVSFTNCSGHFINKLTLELLITHPQSYISYQFISCLHVSIFKHKCCCSCSFWRKRICRQFACLFACLLAHLLACSLAYLLACFLSCLLACLLALLARLLACLLARLLACLFAHSAGAGLHASFLMHLPAWFCWWLFACSHLHLLWLCVLTFPSLWQV